MKILRTLLSVYVLLVGISINAHCEEDLGTSTVTLIRSRWANFTVEYFRVFQNDSLDIDLIVEVEDDTTPGTYTMSKRNGNSMAQIGLMPWIPAATFTVVQSDGKSYLSIPQPGGGAPDLVQKYNFRVGAGGAPDNDEPRYVQFKVPWYKPKTDQFTEAVKTYQLIGKQASDFLWTFLQVPATYEPRPITVQVDSLAPRLPKICSGGGGGCGGSCSNPAMAGYSLDQNTGDLSISDTPIWFNTALGPGLSFSLTYLRDLGKSTPPQFQSHLGSNWSYGGLTYIEAGPATGEVTAKHVMPGGGNNYYDQFRAEGLLVPDDAKVLVSLPNQNTQAVLRLRPSNPFSRSVSFYELTQTDGTVEIYDQIVQTLDGVRYYRTKITDPQGRTQTTAYETGTAKILYLTDATGQKLTFAHENLTDPYRITKITEPSGRTALFTYNAAGLLESSTDMVGIKSEFIYTAGTKKLSILRTPYGDTTFTTGSGYGYIYTEVEDPEGRLERVEVWEGANAPVPGSDATVPTGPDFTVENTGLNTNCTFFWGHKQMREATKANQVRLTAGFYPYAYQTVWAKGYGTLSNLPRCKKPPLENRTWYFYRSRQPNLGATNAIGASQNDPGGLVDDAPLGVTADGLKVITLVSTLIDDYTQSQPHLIAKLINAQSQITRTYYNLNGLVARTIDPLGRTTKFVYDSSGIDLLETRQVTSTGEEVLSTSTYDEKHQPLTVAGADRQVTTYTYNSQNQVETVTNPRNEVVQYFYNLQGRLEKVDGPLAGSDDISVTVYDELGRSIASKDSENYEVQSSYDFLDRPTSRTYPDGSYEVMVYEKLDMTWSRDRMGRWTKRVYNGVRQVTDILDPEGRTTHMDYCKCGSIKLLRDGEGNETKWDYDRIGRNISKTFADQTQILYVYEPDTNRLLKMTDAKGQVTHYEYYLDNTLKRVYYTNTTNVPDPVTPEVSYTYETAYNRPATQTDGTGVTSYSYYPITPTSTLGAGKVQTETKTGATGFASSACTHTYDNLGRLATKTLDGAVTSMVYDSAGRVTATTNPLGTFNYTYVRATGRVDYVVYPNGQRTNYTYDDNAGDQRIRRIENRGTGSTILSLFDYEYNTVGNITRWTQWQGAEPVRDYDYGYDQVDQLTGAKLRTSVPSIPNEFGYVYDKVGNRLSEKLAVPGQAATLTGFTVNPLNQISTLTPGSGKLRIEGQVTKDAKAITVNGQSVPVKAGNAFSGVVNAVPGNNQFSVAATDFRNQTTTKTFQTTVAAGSSAQTFGYDLNGNTTTDPRTTNGGARTYAWDAVNRLISITYADGSKSEFAYDGSSRRVKIVEKDSNDTITSDKRLVWCGSAITEEKDASGNVTQRFYAQGYQTQNLALNTQNYFYTRDHLGSIREVVDSSATLRASYAFDPYGRITKLSGDLESTFGYTGHYRHLPSRFYLTLYRAYDPELGRWLSRDPIAEKGGINLYGYVKNSTLVLIDELGLVDLNFLSESDPLKKVFDNVNTTEKIISVAAHGNIGLLTDKTLTNITINVQPEMLASAIRNHRKWNNCVSIILFSCSTGANTPGGGDSYAQRLARILKRPVEAPNDLCWGPFHVGPRLSPNPSSPDYTKRDPDPNKQGKFQTFR